MDLTLNLILPKVDIFLDKRYINVITQPFTWYFEPEDTSFRENYIHISDFPNRLLNIMTICKWDPKLALKIAFTMLKLTLKIKSYVL